MGEGRRGGREGRGGRYLELARGAGSRIESNSVGFIDLRDAFLTTTLIKQIAPTKLSVVSPSPSLSLSLP